MASIEEILAKAKPRVEEISICLAGDLRAEHSRLVAELEKLQERQIGQKLTGVSGEVRQAAEQIQQLEGEMEKSIQVFRFKGASDDTLESLRERFPPREGKRETWNFTAAGPSLVAACAVEPSMSEAQAELLRKTLAQGDWDSLVETAWSATASRDQALPFSVRASVLTRNTASS